MDIIKYIILNIFLPLSNFTFWYKRVQGFKNLHTNEEDIL